MNISLFKHAKSTECLENISVEDFLQGVKFGKWKDLILPIRAEHVKENRKHLKEKVPCVTISGIFKQRAESKIISHSGFLCIDIDDYTEKSAVINDPYTYSCFESVSGTGFAVIVKINPEKHKDSFRWIEKYYFEKYGIVVDKAPTNVASLRYVSLDPNLEINYKSKTAPALAIPKKEPSSLPVILSNDQVSEYVQQAVNKGANLGNTYFEYVSLAFSIADGFGENGRAYFHALTQWHSKYDQKHADRQYSIAIKDKGSPGQKAKVGSFYYLLKHVAGVDIKTENNKALQIAAIGKKSNRNKDSITEQLIKINGIEPTAAAALVDEVFKRTDISLKTISSDPERLIESLSEWLVQGFSIKKNVITRKFELNDQELSEEKLNTIFLQARAAFNTPHVNFDLVNRCIRSDLTPNYNPFEQYISQNAWRSSCGNLQKLCDCINSTTPMKDVWITKWCLGWIASCKDGLVVRYMLTLLGRQFTGKSEFFRRILPTQLKRYYGESHLDKGKDDHILMCQKLIIQDDEMGGKSKQDEKIIKELTSKDYFNLRVPYGRGNEDLKRIAILCGTSNDDEVINDRTGNTRVLPVKVDSINLDLYNSIDKDELFMELHRLYDSGAEWQLSRSDFESLTESGKEFETINFEREILGRFFKPSAEGGLIEDMTATSIKNYIETNSKQQIRSIGHFGRELKLLFGTSKQRKSDGLRYYSVIKISL